MFQAKVVETIKTHILCSLTFFLENRAIYEIMWKNIVDLERVQVTIWRMGSSRWMFKATHTRTHTDTHNPVYVIITAFPLHLWLHERPAILRYTHIECLVL
jgi:hypothetical protein